MKQIFINLAVSDVKASMEFYTQLGFTINPLFTFEDQKCMVWSEHIYVMLQPKTSSNSSTTNQSGGTNNSTVATFTLPVESLDKVNEIMENGLKAGGTEPIPMIDEGYMQVRTLKDLDGYSWGFIYLDIDQFKKNQNRGFVINV